jgi:hypothetical protein
MTGRTVFLIVMVFSVIWTPAGAASQQRQDRARDDFSDYLPPGAAKELVAKQCGSCHDLGGTIRLRKSRQDWEAIVSDMVGRGAPLMIDEVDPIVAYLTQVFGPASPPLVDVNAAGKDDLMKLPGVAAAAADRLIAHRTSNGALQSRDQAQSVLGLDAAAFEKIKWYLRAAR